MKSRDVATEFIRTDGGTQPRGQIDDAYVDELAEALEADTQLPPVVLFYDGTDYWLADGFHRYHAHVKAKFGHITAVVHQGTQADAQWFSYSANKAQDTVGLRRTNDDKVRAVRAALGHSMGSKMSDRAIAEWVGVSHKMVSNHRATVNGSQSTERTGRDGRTINTANIGKSVRTLAGEVETVEVFDIETGEVLVDSPNISQSEEKRFTTNDIHVHTGDELASSKLADFISAGRKFKCVYADPPWRYGNQATRAATDNHYPTMSVDDICALPIAQIADEDAHLHLWTTNAFLFDAKRVMDAWGFEYRSVMVWCKPQMGIGNYWRVSHEFLLLGIRGRAPFNAHDVMSWHVEDRIGHSCKPHWFRQQIERVSVGPFIELFGRTVSPGWSVWGNQIECNLYNQTV